MTDMIPQMAVAKLDRGECPDCEQIGLVHGPRGGASRNIACIHCGTEFNGWFFGHEIIAAHRNNPPGQPDRERLRTVFGIELP